MHCPYNRSHEISEEKFIWHVTKCKKKYPHLKEIQCPYNPTHFSQPEQFQNHIMNECQERPTPEQVRNILEYTNKKKEGHRKKKENNQIPDKRKSEGKKREDHKNDEKVKTQSGKAETKEEVKIETVELQGKEGFSFVKKKLIKLEDPNEKVAKDREGDCQNSIF